MAFDQTDLRNSRLAIAPATADEDAVRLDQIMPGPVVGIVINLLEVVSIVAPAELANYNGKDAAIIVCKQRGNPDLSALAVFDESCTNAANGRTIVTAKSDPDYSNPKWIFGASYNLLGEINQEGNHIPLADNTYDLGRTSGGNLRWKTINALAGVFGSTLSVASTSNFGDTMTAQAINAAALSGSTLTASGLVRFSGNSSAKATRSTSLSVVTGATPVQLVYANEIWDIASNYNPATGVFTPPQVGIYAVVATAYFSANATGQRNIGIFQGTNGSVTLDSEVMHGTNDSPPAGSGAQARVQGLVQITNVNQLITIGVTQNSGSTLTVGDVPSGNEANNNYFTIVKVA